MEYVAKLLELVSRLCRGSGVVLHHVQQDAGGKHHVQICTNLSCTLMGAEDIVACVEKKLGIGLGANNS